MGTVAFAKLIQTSLNSEFLGDYVAKKRQMKISF